MSKGLESVLKRKLDECVPMRDIPQKRDDLPQIVNVVSDVEMLPQDSTDYRFCLEAIASQLGGNAHYAPLRFAANILRMGDNHSDSSALIYRAGKIVTVNCRSWEHARFCCHVYRLLIEQVETVMVDDGGRLKLARLTGRTQFNAWQVQNTVGFGSLGIRIDLKALLDAAPHVCQYKPDSFPGLKLRVWVKPKEECRCEEAVLKCPCKVKMLIFDSGNVIITGARSIHDINQAFYRFKTLSREYQDMTKEVPRHLRFETRIARLLEDAGVPVADVQEPDDEQLMDVMKQLDSASVVVKRARQYSPFIQACVDGREDNVRWMLSVNPAHAAETTEANQTALQLLEQMKPAERTTEHTRIMQLLQQ